LMSLPAAPPTDCGSLGLARGPRFPIHDWEGGSTKLGVRDALSCFSNPAAGAGEGAVADEAAASGQRHQAGLGPSPAPAAGALATNPQWMISPASRVVCGGAKWISRGVAKRCVGLRPTQRAASWHFSPRLEVASCLRR
jgi:hypothetical protein